MHTWTHTHTLISYLHFFHSLSPTLHSHQFVSRVVEDVYYTTRPYKTSHVSLVRGQPIEVLDISGGNYWLVKTVDPQTGKALEGMIPSSYLTPTPPGCLTNQVYEAETGQKVKEPTAGVAETSSARVQHNAPFGDAHEHPRNLLVAEPHADSVQPAATEGDEKTTRPLRDGEMEEFEKKVAITVEKDLEGEEMGGPSHLEDSSDVYSQSQEYGDESLRSFERAGSHPPMHHAHEDSSQIISPFPPEQYMAASIQSLPASFSPLPPRGRPPAIYLGYDPMEIPNVTLSQPVLVPMIRVEAAEKIEAIEELRKLQEANVVQVNQ